MNTERETKIGTLVNHGGLWIGRFSDNRMGADVELLVNADGPGPSSQEVEQLAAFLSDAQARFLEFRGKLSFSWIYYPIRIAMNRDHRLGVQFQSILPWVRREIVMEEGFVPVGDRSARSDQSAQLVSLSKVREVGFIITIIAAFEAVISYSGRASFFGLVPAEWLGYILGLCGVTIIVFPRLWQRRISRRLRDVAEGNWSGKR